jgi:hypothetical protein
LKLVIIGGKHALRLSHLRVLAASCPHYFCPLGSALPVSVCIAFRLTASVPWLLVAIRLRRNRAAEFGTSIAAKSLNLNICDLLASKFKGCPRDLNPSLFVNLDRNLFAFYFTKDKIAPKRSVDLDYFRTFS